MASCVWSVNEIWSVEKCQHSVLTLSFGHFLFFNHGNYIGNGTRYLSTAKGRGWRDSRPGRYSKCVRVRLSLVGRLTPQNFADFPFNKQIIDTRLAEFTKQRRSARTTVLVKECEHGNEPGKKNVESVCVIFSTFSDFNLPLSLACTLVATIAPDLSNVAVGRCNVCKHSDLSM